MAQSYDCETGGKRAHYACTVCGLCFHDEEGLVTVTEQQLALAPGKHVWSEWETTVAATTEAEGQESRTCSICHKTETRKIDKLAPAPLPIEDQKPYEGKKDSWKSGESVQTDDPKGAYVIETVEKDAAGNVVVCVTYKKAASDLNATEIVIPDEVTLADGTKAKVTKIEKNAFAGNKKITKVTIGKYIEVIGANAFKGCSALKTVTFKGNALTTMEAGVFAGCKKLTKFTITAKVTTIGKKAFYGCSSLKKLIIKSKKLTKNRTGKAAFKGTHKKISVKLPKGLKKKQKTAYKALLKKGNLPKTAKVK